jgi:predicted ferric reductase
MTHAVTHSEKLYWYMARAGGLTSWWLVALTVFWGLMLSTRVARGRATPAWLLDLHRFMGGLSVVFLGLHIAGLMGDKWLHLTVKEALVPMAARVKPLALAWGVIGLYLMVAIEVTSLLMTRLPRKVWRFVHSSAFLLFLLSTVHAFAAGSEAKNIAVQWTAMSFGAMFTFLMVYRALMPRRTRLLKGNPAPAHTTPAAAALS